MSKLKTLFALIAVSAVTTAIPAVASAGTWSLDPAGVSFTETSKAGESVKLTTASNTIACTSSTGSGSYNAGSTIEGTIQLKLHGCTSAGTACTGENAGEPSGTITTTTLTFQNVYLEPGPHSPGVTIKGAGADEHITNFRCGFGLVTVKLTGTFLKEWETCTITSTTLEATTESSSPGNQKWKQVTTTGSIEDLTATVNGTAETASLDGTTTYELPLPATPTCKI